MSRHRFPPGLKVEDIIDGSGLAAERGHRVTVKYRCFLNRGDFVRDSEETGPLTFVLGKREMIAGMEYGIEGMRVGGKRWLVVSPHLAYRDRQRSGVPANAVLRFEVELVDLRKTER
jgi:FKBP-type peptidyl-prolyl cis-trans isomerase